MLKVIFALFVRWGHGALVASAPPALPTPDPTEPAKPQDECAYQREVHCVDDAIGSCALGHDAFTVSPRTTAPSYSAIETRAVRKTEPRACCYVEFMPTICI